MNSQLCNVVVPDVWHAQSVVLRDTVDKTKSDPTTYQRVIMVIRGSGWQGFRLTIERGTKPNPRKGPLSICPPAGTGLILEDNTSYDPGWIFWWDAGRRRYWHPAHAELLQRLLDDSLLTIEFIHVSWDHLCSRRRHLATEFGSFGIIKATVLRGQLLKPSAGKKRWPNWMTVVHQIDSS